MEPLEAVMKRLSLALLEAAVVAAVFAAQPASADSVDDNFTLCVSAEGQAGIDACTPPIQSGQLSGQDLAYLLGFRGADYSQVGQYQRAIQDYDQAIQLEPGDSSLFYQRGNAYRRLGQYQRAIQDYDQAIKLEPLYSPAFYWRGQAKLKTGDNAGGNADIAHAKAAGFKP
jgi:tetratricopeptide (TPR) repeat protein